MPDGPVTRSTLSSGITLLTEALPDRGSVAVGVWVRNGARDEPPERLGIAHFLEHMMFKGTERRDARAIARSLESLGGHLDAFTSREQVCYYARTLAEHLPEALDVLGDIVCHSRLAEREVEREKAIVREEILACEDNPEDKVSDLLSERVWGGHALGRPILGTFDTIAGLSSASLSEHFRRRYRAADLVVAAAGAVSHPRLADLVERHLAPPPGERDPLDGVPPVFAPSVVHAERDLQQLYVSLGARGVPDVHPDRYAVVVLNTLLGGGMSSRLFQSVREEAGLAYSVYSAPDFFRDSGMISIHMGVSPGRGREALARTRMELVELMRSGPTEDEVEAARSQIRGSVLMDHESVPSRMFHLAHEEIYRGTYTPPDELVRRILEVTREQVIEAARRYLAPERFTVVALGPVVARAIRESDWETDA